MTVRVLAAATQRAGQIACVGLCLLLSPTAARAQRVALEEEEPATGFVDGVRDDQAKLEITREIRPLMNVEIGFIKRVCNPTEEQRKAIAAAADTVLTELSDTLFNKQNNAGYSKTVAVTASGQQLTENPIVRIEQEMAQAIRPLISESQFAEYQREVKSRSRFRHEAKVAVLIELLDGQLSLSDVQRAHLRERLHDRWAAEEVPSLQMYLSNPSYTPPLDSGLIVPVLEPDQNAIWNALNKAHFPLYLSQITTTPWEEEIEK